MKIAILLLFSVLEILGYSFLDGMSFFLYSIFCCITTGCDFYFINRRRLEENLIPVFLFTAWLLYNALGFIHYDIVGNRIGMIDTIYLLFIMSTILLFLPFYLLRNKQFKRIEIVSHISPSRKVITVLLFLQLALIAYKIHTAGGLYNYIFASYGEKVEGGLMTFFHLFEGIMRYVGVFLYPFFFVDKKHSLFKFVIVLYVIYTILFGSISGGSLSILSPLLILFTFCYLATEKIQTKKLIKKALLVSVVIGVIGGMLIRTNRSDNSSFQFFDMKTAFTDIMVSPTFDNMVNLESVIENLEPTYKPDEFIYPFVHFLPRNVFPWKPEELGTIVGYKFVGVTKESKAGFIASSLGDFYYDFGYLGIVVGMLFVGYFFAIVQCKLNRNLQDKNRLFVLSCILTMCGATINLSAWYTGSFNGVVNVTIFVFVMLLVQKICGKSKVVNRNR